MGLRSYELLRPIFPWSTVADNLGFKMSSSTTAATSDKLYNYIMNSNAMNIRRLYNEYVDELMGLAFELLV